MIRKLKIINKLLIYKNYRMFLVLFYSMFSILIIINWNYLTEFWIESFETIYTKFYEPLSYLIVFYYFIFSFYFALGLFYPLAILNKKYDRNHILKIKPPKLNRKNLIIASQNILLIIVFPILSILGFIIWEIFSYSIMTISGIFLLLFLVFVAVSLIYFFLIIIKKVLKKIL